MKVLLFTSVNCKPCSVLKPILGSVCDEMSIPLDYLWKENDKDNMFGRYNIMSVPTIMITKDNVPYTTYVGLMSRAELVSKLSQLKEKLA